MPDDSMLGIAFKYESRTLFRNVRPIDEIIEDFKQRDIPHVRIDPAVMKYGRWDLVIAFAEDENHQLFKAGELTVNDLWQSPRREQQRRVNPLKAAKRAAAAGA